MSLHLNIYTYSTQYLLKNILYSNLKETLNFYDKTLNSGNKIKSLFFKRLLASIVTSFSSIHTEILLYSFTIDAIFTCQLMVLKVVDVQNFTSFHFSLLYFTDQNSVYDFISFTKMVKTSKKEKITTTLY